MISFAYYLFLFLSILTFAITVGVLCKIFVDYASYSDSLSLGILFVLSLISFILSLFCTFHFYLML